jgi:enterochelin esterase-like enzyme
LYLFRGHEREWCNPSEDASRGGKTVIDDLDSMILTDKMGRMIVVMPSTSSDDSTISCLGVNMISAKRVRNVEGIGTGRFEEYLLDDLIPHIDSTYRTIADKWHRGVDGFSLGGYTAMLLASKYPERFVSAGCYDGTMMWRELTDPREKAEDNADRTWMHSSLFDAAFGNPRNFTAMRRNNPTAIIAKANGRTLAHLQTVHFHVHSAAVDGQRGNLDRARHFVEVLETVGLRNTFKQTRLTSAAIHTWAYADMHLRRTLPVHSRIFSMGSQ